MKNRRNYYRILHVQPEAPLEIIKASYRGLMTKLNVQPGSYQSLRRQPAVVFAVAPC